MTLIELIGFIITMAAFFLLIAKQARDERKRRQNPEAYEEEAEREHQEAIKDLLRSMNIDIPEEQPESKKPEPPPIPEIKTPPQKPEKAAVSHFKTHKSFKDHYALRKSFDHGDAYAKRKMQQSKVKQMLRGSDSLKQALILKEVLGTPKGLE